MGVAQGKGQAGVGVRGGGGGAGGWRRLRVRRWVVWAAAAVRCGTRCGGGRWRRRWCSCSCRRPPRQRTSKCGRRGGRGGESEEWDEARVLIWAVRAAAGSVLVLVVFLFVSSATPAADE